MSIRKNYLFKNFIRQFLPYSFIGIITNSTGYILYLILTYIWDHPKIIMTILYFVGALTGFLLNRRYSFKVKGHLCTQGIRFITVQISGYLINLSILIIFFDWLGFPHEIVQVFAIIFVALCSFFLLRFYVFPEKNSSNQILIN